MVPIPPGTFIMGVPPREEERQRVPQQLRGWAAPQHAVTIREGFALGKYLVTRAEFTAFIRETDYLAESKCGILRWNTATRRNDWQERSDLNWRHPGFRQTDNDPVVCVNWDDARAYVDWLSRKTHSPYRLPTEAEWEYAARAGSADATYWDDDPSQACRYANVRDVTKAKLRIGTGADFPPPYFACSSGFGETSPVGSFEANRFGLYDMLGNAVQWVEDCWNPNYLGAPSDGSAWLTGDCQHHVLRGSSWASALWGVRIGYRSKGELGVGFTMRQYTFSFRVAGPVDNLISALPEKRANLLPIADHVSSETSR